MIVTAGEFRSKIGTFLELSQNEDILIMKNGKLVSKLTKAQPDDEIQRKLEAARDVAGWLKAAKDLDIDKLREERILGK